MASNTWSGSKGKKTKTYEKVSDLMQDRAMELENSNELRFSREQGFFDKSPVVRLMIIIGFAICLFALLHFREVRVEVLELNSYAPGYMVAQIDFDFYDDEATVILKQESVRDIGKIYAISENQIRQRSVEFEDYLIKHQEWRNKGISFEQIFHASDVVEKVLINLRMTDPRTLHKIAEEHLSTSYYQIFTPRSLEEESVLPSQIWEFIKDKDVDSQQTLVAALNFVVNFFESKSWIIVEDIVAQRNLRKSIQEKVSGKYTHVSAGNRIVDQGEKVSARHIAMLLAMKQALSESRNLWHPLTLIGSLILTLLLIGVCIAYFRSNHPHILNSNRKLFLLVTVILLCFGLSKVTESFLLTSQNNLIEVVRYPLFVPVAAIILCSLMNPGIATFVSGFLTIILAITLAFERQEFILINLSASLVAILSMRSLRQRKEIFVVCLKAWLAASAVIFSLHFYENTLWNASILTDVISTGVFMLFTAVLVVGLLPLLEAGFRIMTDVTLMEYMDPNNDLLRRLTIEAPGTYQHSVLVGNLAEAAALAIGANGLFCRVATLYHDIGKMTTSQYFTENQMGEMNIHQLLTPQESAQVIMAHVSEGVVLAREAGLPEPIIDVIKEHHGTTLVYYFYRKQLEKMGDDRNLVDESEFRYAGPKPRSKESGIIMISDTFEAASRTLEKVNESTVTSLLDRLVREKADDGQFDQCLLTCEEMATVKKVLIKTLLAAGHARVKYPAREAIVNKTGSNEE